MYRFATERESRGWGDIAMKIGEPEDVLALFLLHEAGHIENDDSGDFEAHRGDGGLHLNPQKKREVEADKFAAKCIRCALVQPNHRHHSNCAKATYSCEQIRFRTGV